MSESNNSLSNVWSKISIYCMNHTKPLPMDILRNDEVIKTPFYACEKYYQKPGNEAAGCANRMNLDDYQGIVLKFLDIIAEEEVTTDFTNFAFDYRGARQKLHVKVLKYTDDEIHIGVINKTVIR